MFFVACGLVALIFGALYGHRRTFAKPLRRYHDLFRRAVEESKGNLKNFADIDIDAGRGAFAQATPRAGRIEP